MSQKVVVLLYVLRNHIGNRCDFRVEACKESVKGDLPDGNKPERYIDTGTAIVPLKSDKRTANLSFSYV